MRLSKSKLSVLRNLKRVLGSRDAKRPVTGERLLAEVPPLDFFIGIKGAQLTRLFDCLQDMQVWIKDRRGRYVWVNHAFLCSYALNTNSANASLSQVRGKTDYDLGPRHLADQYHSDDAQVLAGRCIRNRIELVGEADGLAHWSVTNKVPLRAPKGPVVGTAGMTWRLKQSGPGLLPGEFASLLDYFRDHYREKITNEQLARESRLSVRAFERKFRAAFQVSPQKFLRRLRLRMAGRALVFTRQSMVEVALNCGFADQSHFTREFHRHFGCTPREYRQRHAQRAPLP